MSTRRPRASRHAAGASLALALVHWAENVGPGPSVAYIVFSPAFDGKDRRFVDEPHGP